MDFLSEMLQRNTPIAREVTFAGETGTVYFKHITAGQRAALLKGQRIQAKHGESSTYEVDLGQSMTTKHMLVQFSVCNADGSAQFKTLEQVQKADSLLIDVLYQHASDVNSEQTEEETPGKS